MLSKLTSLIAAGYVTASLSDNADAPGFLFAAWMAGLFFFVSGCLKLHEFWRVVIKENPDPSKTYANKAELKNLEESIKKQVTSDDLDEEVGEIKTMISDLRKEFDARQTAATASRKEIHQTIEDLRIQFKGVQTTLEILNAADALKKLSESMKS